MSITNDKSNQKKLNTKSAFLKAFSKSGFLDNIDNDFQAMIQNYWINYYNKKIDTTLHMAFMNMTGRKEVRLIPGRIMAREIFPVFNDYNVTSFYGDKNIYGSIIKPPYGPETVIKKIGGNFFDSEYNHIDYEEAHNLLLHTNQDLIIKLSRANNGRGVGKFSVKNNKIYFEGKNITFNELLEIHNKDFIVQKVIQQHPNLAAPHPSSVNTVRIVTFRWKGEIKYLFGFARFGIDNDIRDNATVDLSPAIGITDSGEFYNTAINKLGDVFTHHPTTNYCFAELEPIPKYENFKEYVKNLHKKFIHIDIIAWDIAVGLDGQPIVLECNFAGSTEFYQLVTQKSFFGDLTEEVLKHVIDEHKNRKPKLMRKHRTKVKVKQKQINKLKNKNIKLVEEIKIQNNEMKNMENQIKSQNEKMKTMEEQYKNLINSKSFKVTKPLRKLSKKIK